MNLKELIERGYFPKELPPPFTTKSFASKIDEVLSNWTGIFDKNTDHTSPSFVLTKEAEETTKEFRIRRKKHYTEFVSKYNSSKAAIYSISKGKLSRRFLAIPNPKHFALLSEKITERWEAFEAIFSLSEFSKSYPVPTSDTTKRSVITSSKSVSDFRNKLLATSFDKRIEVRVDISKFYPTIYTHSVAWALLGREKAKQYFKEKANLESLIASGDSDAELYQYAESVDIAIRSCQERQSIGIPIGPDTSHIIAEIIACRIDFLLKEKFEEIDLKACRYYDDFYLYVSTKDEADQVLKALQLLLSEFRLEINESKVRIKEFPFGFEDGFTTGLFLFDFKKTNLTNSLKHYFSLIWDYVDKNPKKSDWIFKYSLRVFEFRSVQIPKNSWVVFEDLLIKTALIEPSILDIFTRIFITYKSFLDNSSKDKLKKMTNQIIKEHSPVNHNFEISWALWIIKTFELDLEEYSAKEVIKTKDSISNLILLDLLNNTDLVQGTVDISPLEDELTNDSLFSEFWILAYEGLKKGWLTDPTGGIIADNQFFKVLHDLDIEFYQEVNQLRIYSSSNETEIPNEPISGENNTEPQAFDLTKDLPNLHGLPVGDELTIPSGFELLE